MGVYNTKVDLRDIGCEGKRWMELAQDHVQWWAGVELRDAEISGLLLYLIIIFENNVPIFAFNHLSLKLRNSFVQYW
jgi:hypothetical protein